jgi:hypothetical protein
MEALLALFAEEKRERRRIAVAWEEHLVRFDRVAEAGRLRIKEERRLQSLNAREHSVNTKRCGRDRSYVRDALHSALEQELCHAQQPEESLSLVPVYEVDPRLPPERILDKAMQKIWEETPHFNEYKKSLKEASLRAFTSVLPNGEERFALRAPEIGQRVYVPSQEQYGKIVQIMPTSMVSTRQCICVLLAVSRKKIWLDIGDAQAVIGGHPDLSFLDDVGLYGAFGESPRRNDGSSPSPMRPPAAEPLSNRWWGNASVSSSKEQPQPSATLPRAPTAEKKTPFYQWKKERHSEDLRGSRASASFSSWQEQVAGLEEEGW